MEENSSSKVENSEKVIANSHIQAGQNVHVGDINYHPLEQKGNFNWVLLVYDWLKRVLLFLTIIGISIYFIKINISDTEDANKTEKIIVQQEKDSASNEKVLPYVTTIPMTNNKQPIYIKHTTVENQTKAKFSQDKKIKIPTLSDFININQDVKAAFFYSRNLKLSGVKSRITELFRAEGFAISENYFKPKFYSKYGTNLLETDFSEIEQFGFSDKINCLCEITDVIKISPGTIVDKIAEGTIKITLYNTKNGLSSNPLHIQKYGSGMSKNEALQSLEKTIISSLASIDLSICK